VEADATRLERLDRGACELVHAAPPLRGDERLDPGVAAPRRAARMPGGLDPAWAALARPDRMPVVLALPQLAVAGQPVEDDLVRLRLGQPLEAVCDHAAVEPDHGQ